MDATVTTTTSIDAFFDDLSNRGYMDVLNHVNGTVELDIEDTDRRWVTVRHGNIRVSQTPIAADCVLACDAETFIGIVCGRVNIVAASIRGSVTVSGDIALALAIRRLTMENDGRQ